MSKVLIKRETMSAIASAIRSKTKSSDMYLPSQMAEAIEAIKGGVEEETLEKASALLDLLPQEAEEREY